MSRSVAVYQQANVSGDNNGENFGSTSVPIVTLANSPAEIMFASLGSGSNTILIPQVPSPAQYVEIIPPSTGGNKWLMQAGDTTGLQIANTLPMRVSLSTAITSFILRTSGAEIIEMRFW